MKKIILTLLLAIPSLSFADIYKDACDDFDKERARNKSLNILEYAENLSKRANQARNSNKAAEADRLLKLFTVTVSTGLRFGINSNPTPELVERLVIAVKSAYNFVSKKGVSSQDLAKPFNDMDEIYDLACKKEDTLNQYAAVVEYSYRAVGLHEIKPWADVPNIDQIKTKKPSEIFIPSVFEKKDEKPKINSAPPKLSVLVLQPEVKSTPTSSKPSSSPQPEEQLAPTPSKSSDSKTLTAEEYAAELKRYYEGYKEQEKDYSTIKKLSVYKIELINFDISKMLDANFMNNLNKGEISGYPSLSSALDNLLKTINCQGADAKLKAEIAKKLLSITLLKQFMVLQERKDLKEELDRGAIKKEGLKGKDFSFGEKDKEEWLFLSSKLGLLSCSPSDPSYYLYQSFIWLADHLCEAGATAVVKINLSNNEPFLLVGEKGKHSLSKEHDKNDFYVEFSDKSIERVNHYGQIFAKKDISKGDTFRIKSLIKTLHRFDTIKRRRDGNGYN